MVQLVSVPEIPPVELLKFAVLTWWVMRSCWNWENWIDFDVVRLNIPEPIKSTMRTTTTSAIAQRQIWSELDEPPDPVLPGPLPGRMS